MVAVPHGLVDPTEAAFLWAAMALPCRMCMGPTVPTAITHTRIPMPTDTAIIPTIAAISGVRLKTPRRSPTRGVDKKRVVRQPARPIARADNDAGRPALAESLCRDPRPGAPTGTIPHAVMRRPRAPGSWATPRCSRTLCGDRD